ncbi:MAG: hypothetical protein C4542_05490 [Dehalococcoidia bacterium]|nr:MAG: hypothetical protein C4542_05490 [Dehalococcoidia bacterium]
MRKLNLWKEIIIVEKPSHIGRFFAYFVDAVIVSLIGLIPILGGIAGFLYFLLRDGLAGGSSLGKKLLSLRVISCKSGQSSTYIDSIKRNLVFALPSLLLVVPFLGHMAYLLVASVVGIIEVVAVLINSDGRRVGDKLANTRVVNMTNIANSV